LKYLNVILNKIIIKQIKLNNAPNVNPRIPILIWELTNLCDQKCVHCLIDKNKKPIRYNIYSVRKIIDLISPKIIILSGGDVWMANNLELVISLLTELEIEIFSNGNGFTNNIHEWPKKIKFGISLYGDNARTHDEITGLKGSFDRSINAINYLLGIGREVYIHFSIIRQNLYRVNTFLNFCKDNGWKAYFNMQLHPGERPFVLEKCMINTKDFENLIKSKFFFNQTRCYLVEKPNDVCNLYEKWFLTYDGYLSPCRSLKYRTPYQSVINEKNLEDLRNFWDIEFEDCKSCKYREYCKKCSLFVERNYQNWYCPYVRIAYDNTFRE